MYPEFAIIGTGAIGGFYGARLQHCGYPVHFWVRSDYKTLAQHGLQVNSPMGSLHIAKPFIYPNISQIPRADVLLISTKATANPNLFKDIHPLINQGTCIVLLQNGFGAEAELQKLYPKVNIYTGLCFICATRQQPGIIDHQDYGAVRFAVYSNPDPLAPSLTQVVKAFDQAGIETHIETGSDLARWKKLVWNIPFNGLSVLFKQHTLQLVTGADSLLLLRQLMNEVTEAAKACGCEIPESFINKMISDTLAMRPYWPSMMLDFESKRPMEIAAIYENPVKVAAEFNYKMKQTAMIGQMLKKLEADYLQV
jgi:2-dehydropantoate 2-reductase